VFTLKVVERQKANLIPTMFASLRRQRGVDALAREIRAIRAKYSPANFEPFRTSPQKARIQPPKPTRVAPTVQSRKLKVPLAVLRTLGKRPETDTFPGPSQTVETDPLEDEPILERRKLQALVSLYHQSRNFITREELDEHIDNEFGYTDRLTMTRLYAYGCDALKGSLTERRSTPTYTTSPPLLTFDIGPEASATKSRGLQADRPQRLAGVLYGTDERGEPALEAVEEAIQRGGFPEVFLEGREYEGRVLKSSEALEDRQVSRSSHLLTEDSTPYRHLAAHTAIDGESVEMKCYGILHYV
jgi:hypothetical protein